MKNLSAMQDLYLTFIINNPGCTAADVHRACRPQAWHALVYDSIMRLRRRSLVRIEVQGSKNLLFVW